MALLCAASLTVGQAVLALCGRREVTWLSAPVGLATLLVASGIAIKLPGHATAVAITLVALSLLSLAVLARTRKGRAFPGNITAPLLAGGLALSAASLPFIAAGHVGILGVGLVNDDMANHLVVADWIGSHSGHMPTLIRQGYPVGPHALVDGVSSLLGTSLVNGFAGLILALPVLTALLTAGSLSRVRPLPRALIGALVALPYLGAAYLAQEAFKEPVEALLLLGFVLLLPTVRSPRDALPLGLIAAGAVYAYSFPGLIWLAGAEAVYLVVARPRGVLKSWVAAHIVVLILVAPELARLIDFSHFKAFSPSTANSGGLGNLRHQVSPLEALGIWPTSEFRLAAADAAHPLAYYAGALLGACALVLGLPSWLRRYGPAVPAALAAAALVYVAALVDGTVYTSAKALAIASPLVILVGLGGLAGTKKPGGGALIAAVAVVFGLGAAASSFLVLRQAPVGPTTHADELATFRPILEGHKVLFLGRDNFIVYELRGARPFTAVRNYYDNNYVRPNLKLADVFRKFDFDSVKPTDLARFRYVITTRAAYASGPPPTLRPIRITPDFVLWRRESPRPLDRYVLDEGADPGAVLDCNRKAGARPPRGSAVVFDPAPRTADSWSPSAAVESGSSATQTLKLPAGRWDISLQYDASRPVQVTAPGLDATIPANLDYRGSTPYYTVGTLDVSRAGPVRFAIGVERPPLQGACWARPRSPTSARLQPARHRAGHSTASRYPASASSASPRPGLRALRRLVRRATLTGEGLDGGACLGAVDARLLCVEGHSVLELTEEHELCDLGRGLQIRCAGVVHRRGRLAADPRAMPSV